MPEARLQRTRDNYKIKCSHQYWDLGHCIDCGKTQNEIDYENHVGPMWSNIDKTSKTSSDA